MTKRKRRFTVSIWGLPWTVVQQIVHKLPKRIMRSSKKVRNAYRDGYAAAVPDVLEALDIKPDPEPYGDRS